MIPAAANGKAAVVEEAAGSSLGQADKRDGLRGFAQGGPLEQVHELIERGSGVAESTLERLSVVGQRGRPSVVVRFDGLKAVASRPARLARPEGVSP